MDGGGREGRKEGEWENHGHIQLVGGTLWSHLVEWVGGWREWETMVTFSWVGIKWEE
jgi:hypothetical protein